MRETPGVPLQQFRLARAGVSPIEGQFRQEGHAIVGQLTLTGACNAETIQRVKRQEVNERHTNRAGAVGWLVVGSALSAVGVGFLAASADANKQVTCGQARDGDRCMSESSALRDGGISILITGLATAAIGGVFLALKPQVETKDLPETQVSRVTSTNVACAPAASLEGVFVAIELPGNGAWSGRAAADGSVRIEIQPLIPMPEGATVRVTVQSVPAAFATNVAPGAVLGEVTFVKQQAAQQTKSTRKLTKL